MKPKNDNGFDIFFVVFKFLFLLLNKEFSLSSFKIAFDLFLFLFNKECSAEVLIFFILLYFIPLELYFLIF